MEENKGKQPASKGKAAATQNPPKAPVQAQDRMKGDKVILHRLFESDIQNCLKNVSYTPKQPDLRPMPHKHFFHTCDSRGRKLSVSSMIMNHYHDITWGIDPDTGTLWCKSGPALQMVTKRYEGGMSETVPEQPSWSDFKNKVQKDEHVHVWEYVDSEQFTANGLEARRKADREEIGPVSVQPMQTAKPFTAADPARIDEV